MPLDHVCVDGKVQLPLIFLSPVSQTIFFSYKSHLILPVASLWCVCIPERRLVWCHERLSASKVYDIQVVRSSLEFETHDHSQFGRVACFQQPSAQSQLCHLKSGLVLGSVEEKYAPSLCRRVLAMTVRHLPSCYSFKGLSDWPILSFFQCLTSSLNMSGLISCSHCLLSQAYLCMLAKVASGLGITRVKVMTDHMAITFSHATLSIALEDMNMVSLNIFNWRGGLEEDVDWWGPVFQKSL